MTETATRPKMTQYSASLVANLATLSQCQSRIDSAALTRSTVQRKLEHSLVPRPHLILLRF